MPGQPAAPAAGGGFFSTFGFIHSVQRKQAGKPACFFALYRPAAGESGTPRSEQGPGPKSRRGAKAE